MPATAQSAKPAANGDAAKPSGKAYTEGTVAQPTVAPPVPDEGPRSAPREARTAPPAAAATSGRLQITSTPSRASVTVNGRWRGRTPLTLNAMKFGAYSVRVIAPGFTIAREDVALSASDPVRNLAVRLQRNPAPQPPAPARSTTADRGTPAPTGRSGASGALTGSIYVDSRPSGARILVDGRFAETAPARIPESHRLPRRPAGADGLSAVDGGASAGRGGGGVPRDRFARTHTMKATLALENGVWYDKNLPAHPAKPAARWCSTPA